jgi:hypothetical protein
MKRYEYSALLRIIVKAESRESADAAYEKTKSGPTWQWCVGEIVREEEWWQLPGDSYVDATNMVHFKSPDEKELAELIKLTEPVEIKPDKVDQLVTELKLFIDSGRKSRSSVARDLGVNVASVSFWIAGKWRPSPKKQEAIRRFLEAQK